MKLWTTQPQNGALRIPFSAPNFVDLKDQNQVFSDAAVYRGWQFILTGAGEPLRVYGHRVSAGFFPVLGVKPLLCRGFLYEEDRSGNDGVVVISHGLWQSHFAADPNIIGRSLTINDISRTVVGVMPPGFRFESQDNALWVPMAFTPADLNRRLSDTFVIARLKPGVSREQAQAEMNILAAQLEGRYPDNQGKGISVTWLRDDAVGDFRWALLVLVGAGLMIKSFLKLQQVNPGFNTERLLTLETFLSPARYPRAQQQAAFYQQVQQRLAAVPAVQSVGANIGLPFTGAGIGLSFEIEGRSATSPGGQLGDSYRAIGPGYFQTMGVPLLKGRDFTDRDNSEAPGVVIINQSFARGFFQNEDPIGKRLDIGDGYNRTREIVGVVGDTKANDLKTPAPAEMYVVYLQRPWQWIHYAVRTKVEPEGLASAIRAAVWSVDKDIPVNNLMTMDQLIAVTTTEPRFYLILLSIFAAVALILSAVGVYGVMSYAGAQRRHEIGIRMALGARTADVLKLVVGQGMALALVGVALGLAGAFALTRTLSNLLSTVEPTDPGVFAAVAVMIIVVALLASLIPACRAVKVNPVVALRQE